MTNLEEIYNRIQQADTHGDPELLNILGDLVREIQRIEEANAKAIRDVRLKTRIP